MYLDGTGVPQSRLAAFVWWSLAAARGSDAALLMRNQLADRLWSEEIADAQRAIFSVQYRRVHGSGPFCRPVRTQSDSFPLGIANGIWY